VADLSPVEKVVIAGIVAPEFGRERGKAFSLPADHEETELRLRCDLVLRSEDGEILQIEHTRAAGDEDVREIERVRPDKGGKVHELLQECLNARGARGAIVTIVMDPPPDQKKDQDFLAYWLCYFIVEKLRRGRLSYFALDVVEDWDNHVRFVSRWLKKVIIAPSSTEAPAVVITSTRRAAHLVDAVSRFKLALKSKAEHYGKSAAGVILLVDFDMYPLDRLDLPKVQEVALTTRHPFREVWALNSSPGNQGCLRLWPSRSMTDTTQDPVGS
jgi:hypothetical protein